MKQRFSYKGFEDTLNLEDEESSENVIRGRRRKRFSYKDFIDGITANLPYDRHASHCRKVSPLMVNMVWKEAVKYILKELQRNREVYLPYIGYLSIMEQDENMELPLYKGADKKVKVKNFDYVEFKPFKIFLDMLNLIDGRDEKKLNKVIDRAHINEVRFVQQDYEEYAEEYVEPLYSDSEIAFTKAIVKGTKNEGDILAQLSNGTYSTEYSPSARRKKALDNARKTREEEE